MSSMPPPPPPPPPGYTPYPTGPSASLQTAGFGPRLGGRILDGILYGLLQAVFVVPGIILIIAAFKDCTRIDQPDGTTSIDCTGDQFKGGLMAAGVALIGIGLLVVLVVYVRSLGRTGQTWGRKLAGVRVVDKTTGEPIGVGRALGRTLLENTVSGWFCWLGFLWMLWDKDKQTWHDKIVNSTVVRT